MNWGMTELFMRAMLNPFRCMKMLQVKKRMELGEMRRMEIKFRMKVRKTVGISFNRTKDSGDYSNNPEGGDQETDSFAQQAAYSNEGEDDEAGGDEGGI